MGGLLLAIAGFFIRSDGRILRAAARLAGRSDASGIYVLVEREESEGQKRLRRLKARQIEEEALQSDADSSLEDRMAARKARVKQARPKGKL